MNKILLCVALSLCCSNVYSQAIVYNPAQNQKFYELFNDFKDFKILKVDRQTLWEQAKDDTQSGPISLTFDDISWDLILTESNLLNSTYGLSKRDQLNSGELATPFKGYVSGEEESRVSLTIGSDFFFGNVLIGEKRYYFEPLHHKIADAPRDLVLFYDVSNIIPGEEVTCGAIEVRNRLERVGPEHRFQAASVDECFEIELAIASDFSMFQRYGTVTEVENHNIGVMNDVEGDYTGSFDDDIQFIIVTQFVVNCSGCDPWTSSNSSTALLNSFRDWGNNGGFGVPFDLGQIWTARDFSGNIIGVAWRGFVCTSLKYHALQDFSTNADLLRVLTSHEIGHNFNSGHDPSGSSTIMAPSVNNTDQWSNQSVNVISDYIVGLDNAGGCLSPCGTTSDDLPLAAFSSTDPAICAGEQVSFFDLSVDADSWNWTFPGGTPGSSNAQNPIITYNNPGVFDVILEVGNENGFDTQVETGYVIVTEFPVADFNFITNGLEVDFINTSGFATDFFWDFGDGGFSVLENPTHFYDQDGDYIVELTVSNGCGEISVEYIVSVGIPPVADFSADITTGCPGVEIQFMDQSSTNAESWSWTFEGGTPSVSTELNPTVTYSASGIYRVQLIVSNDFGLDVSIMDNYITILDEPDAAFDFSVMGTTVDFNNLSTNWTSLNWDFGDGAMSTLENPQHSYNEDGVYEVTLTATNICGESEFSNFVTVGESPSGGFSSDVTTGCPGVEIQFSDGSSSNVTSWSWSFPGGQPDMSVEQNPTVTYLTSGTYNVMLTVSNDLGMDEVEETGYIIILEEPDASFDYTVAGNMVNFNNQSTNWTSLNWDFGDGTMSNLENPEHEYNQDGEYEVILTAINDCGESEFSEFITVGSSPTVDFSVDILTGCPGVEIQFSDRSSTNVLEWQWTFPGGTPSSSTDQNPIITYAQSGVYDVSLQVTNDLGNDFIEETAFINILELPTPNFDFVANENNVDFTNRSANWTSVSWDFGDGSVSDSENPSHTYEESGFYNVVITAKNQCGEAQFDLDIEVIIKPNIIVGADKNLICIGQTVTYFDQTTPAGNDRVWTFEGGTPATSTESPVTVQYNQLGSYDVNLEINVRGESFAKTDIDVVRVIDLPIVDFEIVELGERQFRFNDLSDSQTGSYLWDFGDGNTSAEMSPIHTYDVAGDYDVQLTITNLCGMIHEVKNTSTVVASEDIDLLNGIGIYPNPNSGNFNIAWDNPNPGDLRIAIYDLLGRLVYEESETISFQDKYHKKCRVAGLVSGIYFLQLDQQGKSLVKPLIIEPD